MNAAVTAVLSANLKILKLSHIAKELEVSLRQARESCLDYAEFLLQLTEHEIQVRSENRQKRRIKEAKFPLLKTFEGFDFDVTKDLNKRLIKELCSGPYIREHRNVIFLGQSGTCKTHLATALGIEVCKQGIRTRFVTAYGLVNELIETKYEKELNAHDKEFLSPPSMKMATEYVIYFFLVYTRFFAFIRDHTPIFGKYFHGKANS